MNKIRYKNAEACLFLLTLAVFFISFFLQYTQHLAPCPLCLMQRFCACLFGLCCMVAMRAKTFKSARRLTIAQFVFALFGIYFAVRQLWLQSLPPDDVPACLPALDIMIQYFPWHVVVETLLWGSSSCAEITWSWLGLSMAAWSLGYFLAIFGISACLLWVLNRARSEF